MSERKIPRKITHSRKRHRKRRIRKIWKMIFAGAALVVVLLLVLCLKSCFGSSGTKKAAASVGIEQQDDSNELADTAVGPIEGEDEGDPDATAETNVSGDVPVGEDEGDPDAVSGPAEGEDEGDPDDAAGPAAGEDEGDPETTAAAVSYVGELPDIDINSWEFLLVNSENTLEKTFEPKVVSVENVEVDERIADALTQFVADTRAQNIKVYLSSAFRSYSWQSSLYQKKIKQGYSPAKAAKIVAPPGTSEHQTGLAADITDVKRKTKNKSLEKTETYKWMSTHCQEYGFIVRFPSDKEDITGIIYEPWHFRYVGKEAAKFIMDNGLCLEEFVALYKTTETPETTAAGETTAAANNSI